MNRRNFLGAMTYGAMGAIGSLVAQNKDEDARCVEFLSAGEPTPEDSLTIVHVTSQEEIAVMVRDELASFFADL